MKAFVKEVIISSLMKAVVFAAVAAVFDSRRGGVNPFWIYLIDGLLFWVIMVVIDYFGWRRRNRKGK